MTDLVCYCGGTEPCYGGPCRFVDLDALRAVDLWLYWAERVRKTCQNVEEYDRRIAEQKKRRADLLGLDPPDS